MDGDLRKMILGSILRGAATAFAGWLGQQGLATADMQKEVIAAFMLFGAIGWSFWQKYGHSIAQAQLQRLMASPTVPTAAKMDAIKAAGAILIGLFLLHGEARAADNLPLKFPAFASAMPCTPQNCSGWYAGFGVLGDGGNVDIVGNGINGSVFSSGGVIKAQAGYQLWSGSWFAAIDASAGYEFTTNTSAGIRAPGGSKFVGTELIKLGYNFLSANPGTAMTTPSQLPVSLPAASSLLAMSTPYFTFGGMQRRGISEWVNGAGVQTVIAAGWSSDVKYLYAPSQQGVPATSIVMIELNKHF